MLTGRQVLIISLSVSVPFMVWVGLAACMAIASRRPESVFLL